MLWRKSGRSDVEVLQPGDTPGHRMLGPLPPAEGPVRVALADPVGGAIVVTRDGLHLPAGIDSWGGTPRFLEKRAYNRFAGKRIELPCFLPWSQVEAWSCGTPLGRATGVHHVEVTGRRYLRCDDDEISNQTT